MKLTKKAVRTAYIALLAIAVTLSGCVSTGDSGDTAKKEEVSAEDKAKAEQEMLARMAEIPESSPLSKLELGMSDMRVRKLAGDPDDANAYQTGKAWIPFYYGTDTHRSDWLYMNEGRVVFSRNRYSGQLKVINVIYDSNLTSL